ncbi:MAG: porin family protein [Planctomycetota bacterium]|jgi:hypothetical protein
MVPRPLVALLLCPLLGSCGTPQFTADAGYMFMELAGEFGFADSGGGVSAGDVKINLGSGLDISTAGSPYAKLEVALAGLRVGLSGFKFSDTGDSILSASFGDITAGSTVNTDLDLTNLKATIAYDIIDFGYLRISPGISLDYFDIDLDMTATSPIAAFEHLEFDVPVPMPYLSAALNYGDFTLDAEVSGISADLEDADGVYWDIVSKLRYSPVPLFEIFAGYRYLLIDADGDTSGQEFDGDVHMNGFFFGASLGF